MLFLKIKFSVPCFCSLTPICQVYEDLCGEQLFILGLSVVASPRESNCRNSIVYNVGNVKYWSRSPEVM